VVFRILLFGTSIGLTPFFLLLLYSLYKGSDVGQNIPQWVDLSVFLILLLFPLSLAYVVVVQRALDLSIIIRQGTRYAFARESLTAVRVLLAVWMAFSINDFFRHPDHQRNDIIRVLCIIAVFFAFRFVLSKRLQQMIDQRFFREAYSPTKPVTSPKLHRSSKPSRAASAPRSTSTASPSSSAPAKPIISSWLRECP
jgi:sigma-B regulation protein RsbU (phosphoserine phosphatase)